MYAYSFVGECDYYHPSLSGSSYDILDALECQADDEGLGEWAEGWFDGVTTEQRKELDEKIEAVFDDWLKKHNLEPTFFLVHNPESMEFRKGESIQVKE